MTPFCLSSAARYALAAATLALLTQCKTADQDALPAPRIPATTQAQPAQNPHVFQVGDQLELFVKEDQTLNGSYLVREGGYIVIPRAGRIAVAGLTREAAEPRVREVLKTTQLKEASVIVERTAGIGQGGTSAAPAGQAVTRVLVYLTGSVPKAGGHWIPVPTGKVVGVYEALLISGGVGKFAYTDRVEVFRADETGKRKRAVIDLRPIMKGQSEDPPISEGDIINVPAKVFGF